MFEYFRSQKFKDKSNSALQYVLEHQNVLDIGMSVARSVTSFAQSRNPLSFIEGGVSAVSAGIKIISGDPESFFSVSNGWEQIATVYPQQALFDIVSSALKSYPRQELKFAYETDKVHIYTLPIGKVGRTKKSIFCKRGTLSKKEVLQFIMREKLKSSNSKIFTITEDSVVSSSGYSSVKYDLKAEESVALPSKDASDMAAYIKRYIDKGISRSIIINGLPGSGKTTIAFKVFQELNLNTLKFKYSRSTNASIMAVVNLLIDTFDINSILLDDFDYYEEVTSMLGFLEQLHKNAKVIIAITNSLRSFPPAILRPGRIDELKTINCLDEEVVKSVLGESYALFGEMVKGWPIAFINELAIRVLVNPEVDPTQYVEELQNRVDMQTRMLGGMKNGNSEDEEYDDDDNYDDDDEIFTIDDGDDSE